MLLSPRGYRTLRALLLSFHHSVAPPVFTSAERGPGEILREWWVRREVNNIHHWLLNGRGYGGWCSIYDCVDTWKRPGESMNHVIALIACSEHSVIIIITIYKLTITCYCCCYCCCCYYYYTVIIITRDSPRVVGSARGKQHL